MIKEVHIRGYRRFREFKFIPNPRMNIVVGGNNAGKSTLLEAIMMALTGRVNGFRAADFLNPYWFNQDNVLKFFEHTNKGKDANPFPEFRIDVYLELPDGDSQRMRGVNNMQYKDATGLSIHAYPDPEYLAELEDYFAQKDYAQGDPGQEEYLSIIPVEYYRLDWRDFADNIVTRKPKAVDVALINTQAIRLDQTMDHYTRQILQEHISIKDRNKISVEHRKMRARLSAEVLTQINKELGSDTKSSGVPRIGIQVDQSRSTSWDRTLTPQIEDIPFALAGQGDQSVAKMILAFDKSTEGSQIVLIEEPENHLSHTLLRRLLAHINDPRDERQIFITTHSSFVLNRLGLDQLALMSDRGAQRFSTLTEETVGFFKKASGFDTLRMVLAENVVLVEGPSDEIVFNRFFKDKYGSEPLDYGIDVIPLGSLSFARVLELASLLDRRVAVLRDRDDQTPGYWRDHLSNYLAPDKREAFVGSTEGGHTLEAQIVAANDKDKLATILRDPKTEDLERWMKNNKTEAAIRIAEHSEQLTPPSYIMEAIEFVGPAQQGAVN